jgi:hypothetical protein
MQSGTGALSWLKVSGDYQMVLLAQVVCRD